MNTTKRSHGRWQRANARADAKVRTLEERVTNELDRVAWLLEPSKHAEMVEKCGAVGACHALHVATETMVRKVRDLYHAICAQEHAAREHASALLAVGADLQAEISEAEISEAEAVAAAAAAKSADVRGRCERRLARTVAAEIEAREIYR